MVAVEVAGDTVVLPPDGSQEDDPGAHRDAEFGLAGPTEVLQGLLFVGG
jgi:hypothetical protein